MTIEIVDNFFKEETFKKLQDTITGGWFPWYFNSSVVYEDGNLPELYEFQFTHTFYRDGKVVSDWFSLINEFTEKLEPSELIRVKANLLTASKEQKEFDFHIDMPETVKGKTAVLYVNTNNGFTVFEDGTKIASIENRLVIFDSTMLHTGTTCSDQQTRCVINFNYIEKA